MDGILWGSYRSIEMPIMDMVFYGGLSIEMPLLSTGSMSWKY